MTNRYTYTSASLLDLNGNVSAFNCIHAASKMLKGKGLTNQSINKAMEAMDGLAKTTGMKGMEPLVFVPVFDRDLTESATGITDLADYFNCPVLDVMMYYCFLADLEKEGFLTLENSMAWSPLKRKYRVNAKVMEAIIQGKDVMQNHEPEKRRLEDQLDFCRAVSVMADSREKGEMDTQELLGNIMLLEEAFHSFDIVKTLHDKEIDIKNRAIFYILCEDSTFRPDREIDLIAVLNAVFDSPGARLSFKSSFLQLDNPLIKEELLDGVVESSVRLTNQG